MTRRAARSDVGSAVQRDRPRLDPRLLRHQRRHRGDRRDLAHAACLAREYGFPSVQLPSALQRIPDGALTTVDGATGLVTIEEEPEEAQA
jgi:hypothetical protein